MELKENIKFCIENFDPETAAKRIESYIIGALEIKEQQIRLEYSFRELEGKRLASSIHPNEFLEKSKQAMGNAKNYVLINWIS